MDSIDTLLADLDSADKAGQDLAVKKLCRLTSAEQCARLVVAAAKDYPNDRDRYEYIGVQLLRNCWSSPHPAQICAVVEHYTALSGHPEKQWQALRILTELKTRESLAAFVDLLQRPESRSVSLELPLVPLVGSFWGGKDPPEAVSALFPAWFELVEHLDDIGGVYSLIASCHAVGLLDFADYPQFVADSVRRARRDLALIAGAGASSQPGDDSACPDRSLSRARSDLEWLLDLFSHMEHPDIPQIVVDSLESTCQNVQLFAIPAALGRGIAVKDELLSALAARPSNRHKLWRLLEQSENLSRFPPGYATIQKLAEANLVMWLEFPTEMGRAPEEIEPLTVVRSVDEQGDPIESHFFKFRHPEYMDGEWFVGFAGTYATGGVPTLVGSGTFSRFEVLESKSIAEHVADYLEGGATK
jgi:hypothetical protein